MEFRKLEIMVDGQWIMSEKNDWSEIKAGTVFRLYEPDGTPVDNGVARVAASDAEILDDEGNWGVTANVYVKQQPDKDFRLDFYAVAEDNV